MEDLPTNSHRARNSRRRVESVVSGTVTKRRTPLGKQMVEMFIGGDLKSAVNSVIFDVLVPSAKEAIAEGMTQGVEKLIFGEARSKRRPGSMMTGAAQLVNYAKISTGAAVTPGGRPTVRRTRSAYEEIVLEDRREASEVLDRLCDLASDYNLATVADLKQLVGLRSDPQDYRWGWTDFTEAQVEKLPRNQGYLLDLPEPEPLE